MKTLLLFVIWLSAVTAWRFSKSPFFMALWIVSLFFCGVLLRGEVMKECPVESKYPWVCFCDECRVTRYSHVVWICADNWVYLESAILQSDYEMTLGFHELIKLEQSIIKRESDKVMEILNWIRNKNKEIVKEKKTPYNKRKHKVVEWKVFRHRNKRRQRKVLERTWDRLTYVSKWKKWECTVAHFMDTCPIEVEITEDQYMAAIEESKKKWYKLYKRTVNGKYIDF